MESYISKLYNYNFMNDVQLLYDNYGREEDDILRLIVT